MISQREESHLDTNNFLIENRKIILASHSKRRIELINLLGLKNIVYENHKVLIKKTAENIRYSYKNIQKSYINI